MKDLLEKKIRDILTKAQATQDAKIKMIANLCENAVKESVSETMYFVRTHAYAGSYPNIVVEREIIGKLKDNIEMRKKVRVKSRQKIEKALANNNVVFYKDKLHRVQKDMFGVLTIVSLVKEEQDVVFSEEYAIDCFALLKR